MWRLVRFVRPPHGMTTLRVFDHVSVDGYFAGPNGEIDWFKKIPKDEEYEKYSHQQSQSGGALMFGHTTYEMMKSYWPTDQARNTDPDMAKVMNDSPKIVISKTLERLEEGPHWKNLQLLRSIDRNTILDLKKQNDITILGSGSVVQQLANLGLIDGYTLVVVPLVLGAGKSLFKDVQSMDLKLTEAKSFSSGIVVLHYASSR